MEGTGERKSTALKLSPAPPAVWRISKDDVVGAEIAKAREGQTQASGERPGWPYSCKGRVGGADDTQNASQGLAGACVPEGERNIGMF